MAIAFLPLSVARAQITLIDTFGAGNGFTSAGSVGGTASIVNAVRFTVPVGNDVNVVSVDMALAISGAISSAQIGIFNESAGLPVGMPIVSAVIPGPLTGTMSFMSTPFAAASRLTAGRNYWVGPFMSGTGSIIWGSGLMGSTSAATFNGTTWAAQSTPNPLSIRVTVNTVALPCCNPRGTGGCLLLTPADCATIGGVANTSVTTCAAALCGVNMTGACCHGATCVSTTPLGCNVSSPGRFLGAGVACTPVAAGGPNPCCPADINNSGAVSVQDIFDFLSAYFAGCP
jgi:hypothetical protein